MRKLYEINADIENCIMNGTDFETGEFIAAEELDKLQMERDAKIEGVALYVKDCRAEAAAIKAEIETLKKRMDRLNRNADGAEGWLAVNLNGQKFSTSRVECAFRRSETVECDDEFIAWAESTELENVLTVKCTVTPNKVEIKKLLKSGVELDHCQLVTKQNIQVR